MGVLRRAYNIADLQAAARRRLPGVVWRFVEGGAEDEVTLRANRAAYEAIHFAPRALLDVSQRSQKVTVFGIPYDAPFGVSSMAPLGLCRYEGDLKVARAARAANVPFMLSTHAFVSLPRVAAEAGAAPWFQTYLPGDRDRAAAEIERASRAGCEVLVVTVDVPLRGNREYNERNGLGMSMRLGTRAVAQGLVHPSWLCDVYFRSIFGRKVGESKTRRDMHDWRDFDWLRQHWRGKLVIKGILTVEDARLAVDHGADGIAVSNHGGRQLDGAPATLDVLPQIAAAVGGRIAVFCRRRRAPRRGHREAPRAGRGHGVLRPPGALRRDRRRRARRAPRARNPQDRGRSRPRVPRLQLDRRARPAAPAPADPDVRAPLGGRAAGARSGARAPPGARRGRRLRGLNR